MENVSRLNASVVQQKMQMSGEGWKGSVLLISDIHFDSPHCRKDLLKSHLEEAKEHGFGIYILGDFWDAMGGRSDPRRSKGDILKEYVASDYMDRLVDEACGFLGPYSHLIAGWGKGNHETSILKNTETDLVTRACERLRLTNSAHIIPMGYTGWIRLRMMNANSTRQYVILNIGYTHGSGGGGVNRGTNRVSKRGLMLPDANVIVAGHIHESWIMEVVRSRISTRGTPYSDTQWHIQLPTYKDDYAETEGWAIEKELGPKPLGGWWIDLNRVKENNVWRVQIQPRRAQ